MQNEIILKDDYAVMKIVRRNGEVVETKISIESIEKLKNHKSKWHVYKNKNNDSYYVVSTVYLGVIDGKPRTEAIRLNRFLVDAKDGEYVDHINHDTLDNRLENLRILSNDANLRNRKGKNSNNTTGYRNVSYNKRTNKYIVQLQINGKNKVLGRFDDVHEAGKFAKEMRKKYYKESIE